MTSTASGRSSQAIDLSSASVIPQTPSSTNHNLVSILGIAQRLNIDQLPISWQEPLGYLHDSEHGAKGGQANISQSLVDVIVSFAFKRFKSLQRNPVAVQAVWQAIVNEMTVLGHEYLQNHPYIVRLQGICWELSKDDHVWPVLVFQKTELGDLSSFAKSGALESLSLEKRLKICMQMGIAMSDMHHNNIIHGDFKPKNVLIFEQTPTVFVPRIADFGFSTYFRAETDSIRMPISKIWYAPDWHDGGFTPLRAMQMDMYSYGLVCFWIVVANGSFGDLPIPEHLSNGRKGCISFNDLAGECHNFIDDWKGDPGNSLLQWVTWMSSEHFLCDPAIKQRLSDFFQKLLEFDHRKRTCDFSALLKLLDPESTPLVPQTINIDTNSNPRGFKITESFMSYYQSDYRLRLQIFKTLHELDSNPAECKEAGLDTAEVSVQLAICYHIGFGTAKDDVKTQELLEKHNLTVEPLTDAEMIFRRFRKERTSNRLFGRLEEQGRIPIIPHADYYREKGLLDKAETFYRREIEDVRDTIGEFNWLSGTLQSILNTLVAANGRWYEAISSEEVELERRRTKLRDDSWFAALSKDRLAQMYRAVSLWDKAEPFSREILEGEMQRHGPDDARTLMAKTDWIQCLANLDRLGEAEPLQSENVERMEKMLGNEHMQTLRGKAILYSIRSMMGRKKEVVALEEELLILHEKVDGPNAERTITCMSNLASSYFDLRRWQMAERHGREVVTRSEDILGSNHPKTLLARSNLALALLEQRKLDEAEVLIADVLHRRTELHKGFHEDTLNSEEHLAWCWKLKGDHVKAIEKLAFVEQELKSRFGEDRPSTRRVTRTMKAWQSDQSKAR